jgi:PAS domain S-box-containing protein
MACSRIMGSAAINNNISNIARSNGVSSSYLQAVIDSFDDELLIIDHDYRIVGANKVLLSRHGMLKEDVIGKHCYEISHDFDEVCKLPDHVCPVQEVWETGKSARATHVHTYNMGCKKGARYIDIIASPITDDRGSVTEVASLMRDVTETKELELRIARAHEDLSALNAIAGVVTQSLNLDTVLSSALDKTLEIMRKNTGGILLLNTENKMLCYRVHRGLSDGFVRDMCFRLGEGIDGKVAQTGETILVENTSTDPHVTHLDILDIEGIKAFVCVPLISKGNVLGIINIASHEAGKLSSEDTQLLDSIASQIAIAIENASLHQEVLHKDKIRGELLQGIFSIQEEERKRIARELHDETSQSLASLVTNLEVAVHTLPDGTDKTKTILKNAQTISISILDDIYKLIYELRPTLLDDLGLVVAIRWLVTNLSTAGIKVGFKTTGQVRRLDNKLEITLFRVIQEAVNNMSRYAHAKNANIIVNFRKHIIRVRIKDDGAGFNVYEAISSRDRPRGLGLLGMRERVELMNGTLSIKSYPGIGTEIDFKIPLNKEV